MDNKDRQIIEELQKDGRLSNHELAERVNLSPSPCLRRLRNLEKQGVIQGYTTLVDQKAWGLPVTVFVNIRLDVHSEDNVRHFEQAIKRIPEIMDCWLLTGEADYLLRVVMPGLDDYENFIRARLHPIGGIAALNTSFAYGVVKQTHSLPRP